MTEFRYGDLTCDRDDLDVLWQFARDTDTPFDLWVSLGFGESHLNNQALRVVPAPTPTQAAETSAGIYQINTLPAAGHGGPPERWMGVEGTRAAMHEMWVTDGRWQTAWAKYGRWVGWSHDRLGFMLGTDGSPTRPGFWKDAQGSVRPSYTQAAEAVSMGALVALYYVETRPCADDHGAALRQLRDDYTATAIGLEEEAARLTLQAQSARDAIARMG